MKYLAIAAAAVLAFEGAALACSCIATDDPAELKRFAIEAAEDAVALVEVEVLTSYAATRTGERMRVVRTLAGSAPSEFAVHRRGPPSSASCDVDYTPGQRSLVILYRSPAATAAVPAYRTSGLCSVHLLDKAVFRDTLRDRIGASAGGERG